MEKQLKFTIPLSLKEIVLRRVAVLLWSDSEILTYILKFRIRDFHNENIRTFWQEIIEDKIAEKILKLKLPKLLRKQMIGLLKPISIEMRKWKISVGDNVFRARFTTINSPDWAQLCWTTTGTINDRKAAEQLVHCDQLDVLVRYRIACDNCLEDYIPSLWEELSGHKKLLISGRILPVSDLQFCWSRIIRGQLSHLDYLWKNSPRNLSSFNQWAFEHSAELGNKTAMDYFYHKLTLEEKETSCVKTIHTLLSQPLPQHYLMGKHSDISFYLLSLLSPEQQMDIIRKRPIDVLLCFLDWPRRHLFFENADLIWTFLPPSCYGYLLKRIIDRIRYPGYYFPQLFQDVFIHSPQELRKYFFVQEHGFSSTYAYRFLTTFFDFDDSDSIEVMFRNVDTANRVNLVFQYFVFELFYINILKDKWHMVEVCLREATLSKEDMAKLKKAFLEFLISVQGREIQLDNSIWKRFFDFQYETDESTSEGKKGQKRKRENYCPE